MIPVHQAGEDAGPAGLVKGLGDAGNDGDGQNVPGFHPAQQGQHRQQGYHRGRNALGAGHQGFGFPTVGQDAAQQVQGQGRQGDSHAQKGQVAGLAGQLEHQPVPG